MTKLGPQMAFPMLVLLLGARAAHGEEVPGRRLMVMPLVSAHLDPAYGDHFGIGTRLVAARAIEADLSRQWDGWGVRVGLGGRVGRLGGGVGGGLYRGMVHVEGRNGERDPDVKRWVRYGEGNLRCLLAWHLTLEAAAGVTYAGKDCGDLGAPNCLGVQLAVRLGWEIPLL